MWCDAMLAQLAYVSYGLNSRYANTFSTTDSSCSTDDDCSDQLVCSDGVCTDEGDGDGDDNDNDHDDSDESDESDGGEDAGKRIDIVRSRPALIALLPFWLFMGA
jgi:hypothetical protein